MEETKYWGYHLTINAAGLNPEKIRSIETVKQYFIELCRHIEMTPYGDPVVVNFGKDPVVTGISGFILIEESNCNLHLVEQNNSGYFDVFSCKPFDVKKTVEFTMNFFEGCAESHQYQKRLAPEIH